MLNTPEDDGHYWIFVDGAAPTIACWDHLTGWTFCGDSWVYKPRHPVDAQDLRRYTLGRRIKEPHQG